MFEDNSMNKLLAWLNSDHLPIPPNREMPSREFAETVRASLSQGNVSMGLGKMFTKEDHDALYESIKDCKFSVQEVKK